MRRTSQSDLRAGFLTPAGKKGVKEALVNAVFDVSSSIDAPSFVRTLVLFRNPGLITARLRTVLSYLLVLYHRALALHAPHPLVAPSLDLRFLPHSTTDLRCLLHNTTAPSFTGQPAGQRQRQRKCGRFGRWRFRDAQLARSG